MNFREDDKHTYNLNLPSTELKNVLKSLIKDYGSKGYVSISPVFEFKQIVDDKMEKVRLAKRSLIGPIISVDKNISSNIQNKLLKNKFILRELEKESSSKNNIEKSLINNNMSKNGILNTQILKYVEDNGIHLNDNRQKTYGDILANKSNDYSNYAEAFKHITGSDILSTTEVKFTPKQIENIHISFIIPCFNAEDTINRTLESINSQEIETEIINNTQVILIDDGSNKPVSDFINTKDYKFHINIIRFEKNMGLSKARDVGTSISTGDITMFIDADILLSKHYIREHLIRNIIIPNAVFVSFKENVESNDPRISSANVRKGLPLPDYSKDLRVYKKIKKGAIGSYEVTEDTEIEILEKTNYFKTFHGSKVFGVYDLSCMITGHNFSTNKSSIIGAKPFSHKFKGWGMEDVYFGLKVINDGNFIIPVLSAGVYHINHEPRSGNEKKKQEEYIRNTKIINDFLNINIDD